MYYLTGLNILTGCKSGYLKYQEFQSKKRKIQEFQKLCEKLEKVKLKKKEIKNLE